jgi:hypothetical protein
MSFDHRFNSFLALIDTHLVFTQDQKNLIKQTLLKPKFRLDFVQISRVQAEMFVKFINELHQHFGFDYDVIYTVAFHMREAMMKTGFLHKNYKIRDEPEFDD